MNSDKHQERPLLIDCDPGADDALALMMAFSHSPKVRVVGITCASGNVGVHQVTLNTARILKLLDLLGKVPIFRGCEEAILVMPDRIDAGYYHGTDGLGDVPEIEPPCNDDLLQYVEKEHGVNAIIRLSKEYEGRLQVVCIGALTNLALASKLDPSLPKRLKSLHIMGGTMRGLGNITPCAEYNFYTDPEAAHIVLGSFPGKCPVQLVTYEAAVDHSVAVKWFDDLISGPSKRAHFFREIFKICQSYELGAISAGVSAGYVLCDSYLMTTVLEPKSIKKSRLVRMGIELRGTITRGAAVIDHRERESPLLTGSPVEIIEEIDQDIYKGLISQVFTS